MTSKNKSKWLTVGKVYNRKDGTGRFLKIAEDVTLKKDMILNLQDPEESLKRIAKAMKWSEEELQARVGKLPAGLVAEVVLAPSRD